MSQLGEKINLNRSLKQNFVGFRHLKAKLFSVFSANNNMSNTLHIFRSKKVMHEAGKNNEDNKFERGVQKPFECCLFIPLSNYCVLELANASGTTEENAEKNAVLTTLNLFPSQNWWKHTTKFLDSDLAEEFFRTCSILKNTCIISLSHSSSATRREQERNAGKEIFYSTISLTWDDVPDDKHFSQVEKVMIGRANGETMREAIKKSVAEAVDELGNLALQQWKSRAETATSNLVHFFSDYLSVDRNLVEIISVSLNGPHEDKIMVTLKTGENIFEWTYCVPHLPPVRRWKHEPSEQGVLSFKKSGAHRWTRDILGYLAIIHLENLVEQRSAEAVLQESRTITLSRQSVADLLSLPRKLSSDSNAGYFVRPEKEPNDDITSMVNTVSVPDILQQIHQIRQLKGLPFSSFPKIKIDQKAFHNAPLQMSKLQNNVFGDVSIFSSISLSWPEVMLEDDKPWSVEVVSDPASEGITMFENSVKKLFFLPRQHAVAIGPLLPLVLAVQQLYRRVFPNKASAQLPLLDVRNSATQTGLDFLLYSWFGASPQIKTYQITVPTEFVSPSSSDLLVARNVHGAGMIRAMLLYDFLGQRVLFGETHALTFEEAVTRLRTISVEANLGALTCVGDATFYRKEGGKWVKEVQPPTSASLLELFHPGAHPPSAVAQRPYRSTQLYRQYTHERRLLQAFLRGSRERGDVLTTDHLVNYVMEKRSLNAWDTMTAVVEGLIGGVELSFLSQTSADGRVVTGRLRLTCGTASDRLVETVDVTERVGVLPALLLLCGNAVRSVTKERVDWDYLQTLLQPTLWDGRFPAYTPEYYYAPNFLGELLQGVCGKYTCRYETVLPAASDVGDAQKMEGRVRTVFYTSDPFIAPTGGAAEGPLQDTLTECRLSVACLTGVHNGAEEGFLLGIGRGRTRKEAWWAASCAALNANFPSVVAQLEDYKQFCEWRRDPGMLLTLGAPFGLRMRHSSRVSEGHTVWAECAPPPTIAPASVIHAYGAATSWTYSATAATPAASFAAVMDEMRRRLKVKRADNPPFALWEDSNHYRKSVWHALCGAVAIASKGKSVTVQFEFAATADPTSADFTLHLVRERLVKLRVQKETSRYEWRKDQQILLTLTSTQVTELIHGGKAEHSMLHFFLVTVPLLLRHTLLAAAPPAHVRQETNLLLLLQGQYGLEGRPLSLKRRIVWCVKQWTGCPCAVQVRRGGDGGWSATLTVQVPRYERRVENTDRPGRRTVCLAVTEGRTADRAEHALWRLLCQTWGVPLHKEADASDGILSDLFL